LKDSKSKNILDLNAEEARNHFFKQKSYFSFELPQYFIFEKTLKEIHKLFHKEYSEHLQKDNTHPFSVFNTNPNSIEDINYKIHISKDGKFGYRQVQLIHPVLYVKLVYLLTLNENWTLLQNRFKKFKKESRIQCLSIPISENNHNSDKKNQLLEWWREIEQVSISLALDYNHLLHLDISDCYGSIYTHTITWALHSKAEGKQSSKKNDKKKSEEVELLGDLIDSNIQGMSYGQTNGIPQGSILMDFIAEIVLGYADCLITKEIEKQNISEFKILRYRDDYRVFTNDSLALSKIAKICFRKII
jgi:RNA-directed DNA polymerase